MIRAAAIWTSSRGSPRRVLAAQCREWCLLRLRGEFVRARCLVVLHRFLCRRRREVELLRSRRRLARFRFLQGCRRNVPESPFHRLQAPDLQRFPFHHRRARFHFRRPPWLAPRFHCRRPSPPSRCRRLRALQCRRPFRLRLQLLPPMPLRLRGTSPSIWTGTTKKSPRTSSTKKIQTTLPSSRV